MVFTVHRPCHPCGSGPQGLTSCLLWNYRIYSTGETIPYREITGSSALMSAVTFHRGVVASDLPFFRETLMGEPDAGRLALPDDPDALARTIPDYLHNV